MLIVFEAARMSSECAHCEGRCQGSLLGVQTQPLCVPPVPYCCERCSRRIIKCCNAVRRNTEQQNKQFQQHFLAPAVSVILPTLVPVLGTFAGVSRY